MPNWASNEVTLIGTHKDLVECLRKITTEDNPFCLNKIVPMPEELVNSTAPPVIDSKEDAEKVQALVDKYGAADWYNWARDNWGTKWDTSEHNIHTGNNEGVGVEKISETHSMYEVAFMTAWCPPSAAYEALAKQFPNIRIDTLAAYEEEGFGTEHRTHYNGHLKGNNNMQLSTLAGRKIVEVSHLSAEEAEALGMHERMVILRLDDGSEVDVQSDPEGNGCGCLVHHYQTDNGVSKKYYCSH